MTKINKILSSLKNRFDSVKETYFSSHLRVFEFIFVGILYISIALLLMRHTKNESLNRIVGQFQIFVAVYLAYRYRFFALSCILFTNFIEIVILIYAYTKNPMIGILAGLTSKGLTIVCSIIVSMFANFQEIQNQKLHEQKCKLELLSVTDDLTGAYNHRFFNATLDKEIEKSKETNLPVALLMIDIDNFKMCNDVSGHDFGDCILKGTASILKEAAGEENIVCRYGGDEFAVILPGLDLHAASQLAHKIRNLFEIKKAKLFDNHSLTNLTLSMGFSVYPTLAYCKDDLISQADMALYHSKNLGKDKIHFYQDVLKKLKKHISSDHQHMIGVFKGLLSTISAKDKYTRGHCERVAHYSALIGKALNLNIKDTSILQYAALLHDIGKIEVPKLILSKVGKLNSSELDIIRQHPVYSANILEPLSMNQLIDYVLHHHERYDGTGYPHGLAGNSISLGARILCVADSFDAMLSERPYSSSMNINEAFQELEKNSGTQFDPEIVKVFIKIMKESEEYKKVV